MADGFLQYWQPGDSDHRNLGGTIRSLDRSNRHHRLSGVHAADMTSPDDKANTWLCSLMANTLAKCSRASGSDPARFSGSPHDLVALDPDAVPVRLLNQTLDQQRYAPGILSRSGYFLLNDSTSAVLDADGFAVPRDRPGYQDWWFFGYADNAAGYRQALANFMRMSGPAPLPAKGCFGIWLSRWPSFGQEESKSVVARWRAAGIAPAVLVIDMEWHKPGWCHWDWDHTLFPDPQDFFRWAKAEGLLTTLNVHPQRIQLNDSHHDAFIAAAQPAPVSADDLYQSDPPEVQIDLCDRRQAEPFFRILHDPIMKLGMDFWWLDGTAGRIDGSTSQLINNKLYFEHSAQGGRRGMLFSRWGGLGSHRYGAFFTADTYSQWETLAKLCEFNIRAGHVGMAYLTHDTCGFVHPDAPLIDPLLYLRWLQFGVFNPLLRFHSAPGSGSRMPWDYGSTIEGHARFWLQARNRLVPYLYAAARRHHDSGMPIVRGMFFDQPADMSAQRTDQFFFGDHLLVAPLLTPDNLRDIWLPEGRWFDWQTGVEIDGGHAAGTGRLLRRMVKLSDFPVYARAGAILPLHGDGTPPGASHVDDLLIEAFPGGSGTGELYEDDGQTDAYRGTAWARTALEVQDDGTTVTVTIAATTGRPLAADRHITVAVALGAGAASVTADDGVAHAAVFDPATGRVSVDLGRRPVGRTLRVLMKRKSPGCHHPGPI